MVGEELAFTIGRARECDVVLPHESVSRVHAELRVLDNGRLFLTDRRSKNGTVLVRAGSEERVRQAYLSREDTLRFGDLTVPVRELLETLGATIHLHEGATATLPDGSTFSKDEYPRPGATVESVAKLKPAFRKDGTVTAASSSGINDGAAALLVSKDKTNAVARIVTTAVAGVDPSCMGLAPVPATRKKRLREHLKCHAGPAGRT